MRSSASAELVSVRGRMAEFRKRTRFDDAACREALQGFMIRTWIDCRIPIPPRTLESKASASVMFAPMRLDPHVWGLTLVFIVIASFGCDLYASVHARGLYADAAAVAGRHV